MSFMEVLRLALLDLALHKFRSLLAVLGIIFGVASVEGMLSISEGARQEMMRKYAALGIDNVLVRTVRPTNLDSQKGDDRGAAAKSTLEYGLLRRDLEHIRKTFASVRRAVGLREMRMDLFSPSGEPLPVSVLATEPQFLDVTRSQVTRGRFLTDLDQQAFKRVCVLGSDAARRLFQYHDPMHQSVRMGEDWYEVVGLVANPTSTKEYAGQNINACMFIPLETARTQYGDFSYKRTSNAIEFCQVELDGILVQVEDPLAAVGLGDRLKAFLAKTHKVEDWSVSVPLAQMRQKEAEQRIWSIVMGAIAGISLVVGGIGIMNIMLANVSDRRKEIGTRRALGARRREILSQFVLEAATLTSLGGLLGAALGYSLAWYISWKSGWPTVVTTWTVGLGVVTSTAVGILFGYWPARQAARVNPIEALRSE